MCNFYLVVDTKKKGRDEDRNLTQQECEKIIEVLLSQERVLTLLYDKTFPPRPQSQVNKPGYQPLGVNGTESMRQFNYFNRAQMEAESAYDENDVQLLEREIEHVIRCGTAQHQQRDPNIINVNTGGKPRTAATAKRPQNGKRRRNIPVPAH